MPKVKGKQIEDGTITATQIDETGTLSTVNAGDAAVGGSAAGLARKDHQHAVATGASTAQVDIGDTAAEGSSANLAREDHQHALPAPAAPANVTKAAAAAGSATTVARADHKHDVATAAAVELTDATNAEGASTSLARADHTHSHGSRGGGTLHAAATPSVNGFLTAADKTKLDTLVTPNIADPKQSVRLLENTANVTPLSGLTTVDGIAPAVGERVALFAQSTPTEDGIYIVASPGPWTRAPDFAVGSEQASAVIPVEEGSTNADSLFMVTNDVGSATVGTHNLVALKFAAGTPRGAGAGLILSGNDLDVVANADASITVNANDIQVGVLATDAQHGVRGGGTQHALVVPAGLAGFMSGADKTKLNGIPTFTTFNQESVTTQLIAAADVALTDTLNNTPISNVVVNLYLNGVHQEQGVGKDYTISGVTITWLASSGTAVNMQTNDVLIATYLS